MIRSQVIFENTDISDSESEQEKYIDEEDAGEREPTLIIIPNKAWIDQYSWTAYNAVMDTFATYDLPPNQRRDKNSRCMFHFKETSEFFRVRNEIRDKNLASNAFCIPFSLRELFQNEPNVQLEPIGNAWILMKVGSKYCDHGCDRNFFKVT
ncbi:13286_t:CDS:2 [Dentiscutata erythropus]|uniref:13286_t:CDS:1 n=1 Tax=Dentiscutata erythropus TaxID=1348616 RepID=A0A9N8VWL4_9GLOM|nr:13286_t:CDS:2 [Dentiscutata erythropus]